MAKKPTIGIDLGTTNTCVAALKNGKIEIIANDQGSRTTPSYVAFTETERLVGDTARDQIILNPQNTVFCTKRLIGRRFDDAAIQSDMEHWPFKVIDVDGKPKIQVVHKGETKLFFPEEISSMILTKMKQIAEAYLGKTVTDAVVTVPAYFNNSQRQATKDAGTIAGLNILRIINEPTAAAIAYGLNNTQLGKRNVLVFDIGGGTLDVSILNIDEGLFEVKSTVGDSHLGGEDFDNRLVNYLIQEFKTKYHKDLSKNVRAIRRLKKSAEKAKRILSSAYQASIEIDSLFEGIDFYIKISRVQFEMLNADLFACAVQLVSQALSNVGMDKSEIKDLVLVGGSSRIPKIQKLLKEFFNEKELSMTINPDEAVAYGAAVQAAILNGDKSEEIKDVQLQDVTPLSLGVEVLGKVMSVVVKRNTCIPTQRKRTYKTCADNQKYMTFNVFEGERALVSDNDFLASFEISNITLAPRHETKVDVIFEIDANSILTVTATERSVNNMKQVTIKRNKDRFSKSEIARMVFQAEKYHKEDDDRKKSNIAKIKLEYYCYDIKSDITEKWKGKISKTEEKYILEKCYETIKWIRNNDKTEVEIYENKLKELQEIWNLQNNK